MRKSFMWLKSSLFLFLATSASLSAQSTADEIETLLNTSAVSYAQAARFVLEASDAAVIRDPEEAFRYAAEQKWLPKNVLAGDAARLDAVSLLLMRSFGVKGGMLYSITKSPHYAYRELTYKDTIQGRADPHMEVSGEKLLFITNRILARREAGGEVADTRQKRRDERAAAARREAMAAEINAILEEQNVTDTVAEATGEGVVIRLSNIQFTADSTRLPPSEMGKLVEIANILKTIPDRKIQVAGHTADAGSREGQRTISLERAKAVAAYLVSLGARGANDIITVGHGADFPVADNSTAQGMALNRRVEIIILEN